jgi:hypothetical protein
MHDSNAIIKFAGDNRGRPDHRRREPTGRRSENRQLGANLFNVNKTKEQIMNYRKLSTPPSTSTGL